MTVRTKSTLKRQLAIFLDELCNVANVTRASQIAGFAPKEVYRLRKLDPDLAKAWQEAIEIGNKALEDEARRRAYEGVPEPVFYQGAQCGIVQKYSDTLLMFLLNATDPDRFKRRSQVDANVTADVKVKSKVQFYLPENGRRKS